METIELKVKINNCELGRLPTQATDDSNGLDLYAAEKVLIPPNSTRFIQTYVATAIPSGYVGLICPRSGLAKKNGLTILNGPGVLDSDYRDNIGILIHNTNYDEEYVVKIGDRIAQLVVVPSPKVKITRVDNLNETSRTGGFGSTGV